MVWSCELLSDYCNFDIIDNKQEVLAHNELLWIALRLLYLWHYRQHWCSSAKLWMCCELLSDYCIFDITDNWDIFVTLRKRVVNCFQIIVSLTSQTTTPINIESTQLLWIAFRLLYLWHHRQRGMTNWMRTYCCELLSDYCIFDITDNSYRRKRTGKEVVNCFQIIVSLTSQTTSKNNISFRVELWIAFRLLYLWHHRQRKKGRSLWILVVNCFQIIVSLTSQTTVNIYRATALRCELLSDYCIFDITDNGLRWTTLLLKVVNCFQIIVSLTSQTT